MARRCFAPGTLLVLALALNMRSFSQDAATVQSASTIDNKNRAILKKLEQPIPLTFEKVPLGDVFEYVTYLVKDGLLTITSRTPDDPEGATRDAAVLNAVLDDLLTRSHPESPLFDKTHIFLAPDEVAPSLKVSEVIHELQLRDFSHVSPADLALGREAANELIRRKDVAEVLNQFAPSDQRVILWDDAREDADRKKVFFQRAQVFRALAPGYSRDHKFAVVYMRYPLDIHAGWGSWGLALRNGKWVVVFRDLWSS